MSSISDHTWGISPAADRIWSEVPGLRSSEAGKRLFMVLQAYIDESYEHEGVFVLGGYIASAESWAAFSKEWEEMLPHGTLNKHDDYHFKMSEMAQNDERMSRVPGFYRIIEKHVLASISAKINIKDLRYVQSHITVPDKLIDWDKLSNPYFFTFHCLMSMFHLRRKQMTDAIPLTEKVDFYFDEQSEKRAILDSWDGFLGRTRDEVRQYYGEHPRFGSDEKYLPLQAADFWAWWVRKWYVEGTPEKVQEWGFDEFEPARKRKYLRIEITYDEDQIAVTMMRLIRENVGPSLPIIYVKTS